MTENNSSDHQAIYFAAIRDALALGRPTEHTYRPAFKRYLESVFPNITATNEPARVDCGAPDFVITRMPGPLTIGYIETKDIGKSLDEAERSDQLKRYRKSLSNLILTDYLEFRWYVNGTFFRSARLATLSSSRKLTLGDRDTRQSLETLLQGFLERSPEKTSTPRELASRMSRLTHIIRDVIVETYGRQKASVALNSLREAFAQTLLPGINLPEKTSDFADMYAQTIAYGLFAARCNHKSSVPFQRLGAANQIPKTNPFLRKLFETVTGTDLEEEPYVVFVDDLV